MVIQESDYARIPQRKKVNGKWITEYVDAPRKSAFRKLARFYGVSTEITEKTKETHPDGGYTWHYTVKATAGGVSQDGEGSCTSSEKGGKSEHDTRATAHTRAKSRAISDLIGFGQVSAEEYNAEGAAPRKQVDAEARSVEPQKGEAAAKPSEKEMRLNPKAVEAEEAVKAALEANGLTTQNFLITVYGDHVWVQPPEDITQDGWNNCNTILGYIEGKWSREGRRWEVPRP